MPQFFIDKTFRIGDNIEIRGSDARHISQVLRLKTGDWIILSDGDGNSFRAIIEKSSPSNVTARIQDKIARREGKMPPALALALIKADRFEWAIEKAVELGCRRIVPFKSARTVPQYTVGANAGKIERWQKIALAAAKQSGLPFRPVIETPLEFSQLMEHANRAVLFYEGEEKNDIRSLWNSRYAAEVNTLIIGPEGGFTGEEILLARQSGVETASLGTQILRVETAAIAALTIWQYELGNMDAL